MYSKFVGGVVEQVFTDDGECVSQSFKVCDLTCEYERDGKPIDPLSFGGVLQLYQPFDMVQPNAN